MSLSPLLAAAFAAGGEMGERLRGSTGPPPRSAARTAGPPRSATRSAPCCRPAPRWWCSGASSTSPSTTTPTGPPSATSTPP
ncbi:hypothetical protein V2I01_23120 [Micromonospora sp. BRA006-A]|nr:hypothetical protein [Micromonospora sp. BRA006-A]